MDLLPKQIWLVWMWNALICFIFFVKTCFNLHVWTPFRNEPKEMNQKWLCVDRLMFMDHHQNSTVQLSLFHLSGVVRTRPTPHSDMLTLSSVFAGKTEDLIINPTEKNSLLLNLTNVWFELWWSFFVLDQTPFKYEANVPSESELIPCRNALILFVWDQFIKHGWLISRTDVTDRSAPVSSWTCYWWTCCDSVNTAGGAQGQSWPLVIRRSLVRFPCSACWSVLGKMLKPGCSWCWSHMAAATISVWMNHCQSLWTEDSDKCRCCTKLRSKFCWLRLF